MNIYADNCTLLQQTSFRLAAGALCLMAFVVINAYSSILIANLTVPKLNPVVNTLEELASSTQYNCSSKPTLPLPIVLWYIHNFKYKITELHATCNICIYLCSDSPIFSYISYLQEATEGPRKKTRGFFEE